MARLPRLVVPNHLHHVVASGNNAQSVFLDDEDYRQFLDWLREAAQQYRVAIHGYALLPGRVHLMATPADEPALGRLMQAVGRLYVPWFNARHGRSGSLWEGRFRATVMDAEDYFCSCAHWVEYQPVLAGLTADMASYPWSSHAHHVGLRKQGWLTDHPVYWSLGNTPFEREAAFKRLCDGPPDQRTAEAIEAATRKAWALGREAFKASLAKLTDRRLQPARRGRPPRSLPTPDDATTRPVRGRAENGKRGGAPDKQDLPKSLPESAS